MTKNTLREIRYHSIFWLTYVTLWGARDMVFYPDLLSNTLLNFIFTLPAAPFVYFNLYFMVPRYLFKKRWGIYLLFFVTGFALISWWRSLLTLYIFQDVLRSAEAVAQFSGLNGIIIVASENLILITITMALFFVREWYVKERYTRELEQKNIESELNLLKTQLQPHFLFNNLNTIYFLMESNPALAKEVMLQFSDVLSHQLYNAKKDKVPLKEELESLENYIKIQTVRHEDFLDLKYIFPSQTHELQIAPMILLTFVENAFKHGQKEEGYQVNIDVEVKGKDLRLHVVNTNGHIQKNGNGGVGLQNVKRRLSLIYPEKHKLVIDDSKDSYTVDLILTLDKSEQA